MWVFWVDGMFVGSAGLTTEAIEHFYYQKLIVEKKTDTLYETNIFQYSIKYMNWSGRNY